MATLTKAVSPVTLKSLGKDRARYQAEVEIAVAVAAEHGAEVFITDAPYQVAKVIGPTIRLVIYPHTSSARRVHLRVRACPSSLARRR